MADVRESAFVARHLKTHGASWLHVELHLPQIRFTLERGCGTVRDFANTVPSTCSSALLRVLV